MIGVDVGPEATFAFRIAEFPDLCLRPPIDEFGVLEFEAIDRIVEVGYRYACEKLEQIRSDKALPGIFLAA